MKKQIHVRVSPIGEITVETQGFKGQGCEAATKAIEATPSASTPAARSAGSTPNPSICTPSGN
jgi:hypothetical protein